MISVLMAPGEADREKEMRRAMDGDKRFGPLQISADIPVDLQFRYEDWSGPIQIRAFNVELKIPQDFVGSVLNGHLTDQVFSMLEARKDGCTVILGALDEIYAAVKESAKLRKGKYLRGDEARKAIAETHLRCKSFRKRSFINGVPVFHKGDDSGFFDSDDQFKDILELAHDYLCDGSLFGFVNRPPDHMRELAATAMLFHGMGAKTLAPVLDEYKLCLIPRGPFAHQPCDLPGIGKKRAAVIDQRVKMVYGV
jgi:hypothetical protein